MPRYVALLRAVNVGGTGKLSMNDLRAMCVDAGFSRVETYIASGNVILESAADANAVKLELEARLAGHAGKPLGVLVRTAAEMRAVLEANPFADRPAKFTIAIFLDGPPPADALANARGLDSEETRLGAREIYVHYPEGMGRSKLVIPAARSGTARNMNTGGKLAALAATP